jgi:hypothetical protein
MTGWAKEGCVRKKVQSTGHGYRSQIADRRAQSTEHRAQSTEHRAQSTEHGARSTEHGARSTQHATRHTPHATAQRSRATPHHPPRRPTHRPVLERGVVRVALLHLLHGGERRQRRDPVPLGGADLEDGAGGGAPVGPTVAPPLGLWRGKPPGVLLLLALRHRPRCAVRLLQRARVGAPWRPSALVAVGGICGRAHPGSTAGGAPTRRGRPRQQPP